jgi:hypothetical protein
VDLQQAWELHLSHDAVAEFLGGPPSQVADHYREADPMKLSVQATQWLIHGASDTDVPSTISRSYAQKKQGQGEKVHYLEISTADHLALIDPRLPAWPKVESTVVHLLS